MRSIKLLAAMAVVAALVAGPVLAQTADTAAPAMEKTAKHHAHKAGKKHHAKKKTEAAAPAAEAPAAQ